MFDSIDASSIIPEQTDDAMQPLHGFMHLSTIVLYSTVTLLIEIWCIYGLIS